MYQSEICKAICEKSGVSIHRSSCGVLLNRMVDEELLEVVSVNGSKSNLPYAGKMKFYILTDKGRKELLPS